MGSPYAPVSRFCIAKPHFFKEANLSDCLVTDDVRSNFTGTKVVATNGPACQDVGVLCDMLNAGMVGVRLDLAKGTLQFHQKSLDNLQKAMAITKRLCCIIVDTQGRKVMVRKKERIDQSGWAEYDEDFCIRAGTQVTITSRTDVEQGPTLFSVDYEQFADMVQAGDTINVGKYLLFGTHLTLKVDRVEGKDVHCTATNDSTLEGLLAVRIEAGGKGGGGRDPPLLNTRDKECLLALCQHYDIDFLALGYTRSGEDVRGARAYLDSIGMKNTKIIAKMASRQSLYHFEGILDRADGIIISRGPLGMDCLPEKMALVQKLLIKACNLVGKPVIVSRVLDTMVGTPRPTRAEATDVANAVLDGVDGFLLGAETVKGSYPVQTVQTVMRIARAAEKVFDHQYHYEHLMEVAVEGLRQGNFAPDAGSLMGDSDQEDEWSPSPSGPASLQGSVSGNDGGLAAAGATPTPTPATAAGAAAAAAPGDAPAVVLHAYQPGAVPKRPASHLKPQGEVTAATAVGAGATAATKPPLPPGGTPAKHVTLPSNGNGAGGGSGAGLERNRRLKKVQSVIDAVKLSSAAQALAWSGLDGSSGPAPPLGLTNKDLFKLESLAYSAVRTADAIHASLIVVYTHTGQTAQLVAKYRPPMPILTLVVPHLRSDVISWSLEGRSNARQCLLSRGVLPMLSAPGHTEDVMLQEAVRMACKKGLVKAHDYVVCVQRIYWRDYCVKVISVDELGHGIQVRPRTRATNFQQLPGVLGARGPAPGASSFAATSSSFARVSEPLEGALVKTTSMRLPSELSPSCSVGLGARGLSGRLGSVDEEAAQAMTNANGLVKTLSMMPGNF